MRDENEMAVADSSSIQNKNKLSSSLTLLIIARTADHYGDLVI